jgi:hypothetical protein
MVASRPGSPYTGGRPSSANSVHTKVEEDLHEFAGIDYDKVRVHDQFASIHKLMFVDRSLLCATLLLLFSMNKL